MGKSFTRALRHLKTNHKTTKLDEKKEMLNEIPTMHTGGVYSKNPPGFRYDPPSPAKRFIPDVDGNWPAGVPGTPGATEYIRPQGYWVNDSDWETKFAPNMSNDSILESPTNTDGFIDAQSGTVKTLLPPNSRSFILGPLVDGYNYNHGYDDYTTIGYIQKDTRQFVLLGTIDGHWDTNVTESGFTPRLWDGTTFTAYNPSFTLAMAQWFKDRITANDYTKNFPYFYSGGVAQSPLNNQPPGSPGGMIGGNAAGTGGGGKEPSDGDGKAAVGSGGTPDIGTETPQGDPEGGDAASQGYPAWGRSGSKNKRGSGARGNRGRKKPKPSTPKPQGGSGGGTGNPTNRRGSGARNRGRGSGSGGSGGSTGAQGGSGGGQGNRTNQRGSGQRNRGSGSTPKPTPKPTSTPKYQQNRNRQNRIRQDQQARNRQSNLNSAKQSLQLGVNIARGITDKVKYAGDYMFKGLPKSVKEYLPDFKGGGPKWAGGKKITDLPILKQLLGRDVQYFTPDLDTSIKYAGKNGKVVVVPRTPGVRGWKNWLGSNVSRGFDPTKGVEQIVKTSDTIAAKNLTKVIDLSKPGARETLQNLAKKGATTNKALSKLGKAIPFLNAGLVTADVTNRVRNGDYAGALLGAMQIIPGPIGWIGLASQVAYDVTGGNSPGRIPWNRQVSESVEDDINDDRDLGKALIELGLPDNKEDFVKEIGFYYSLSEDINPQLLAMVIMAISGEEMSKEQKEWIEDNIPNLTQGLGDRITKLRDGEDVQEGYSTLLEDKKRILREITQPLKEIKELPKTQKLEKYRPNFAGKYKPQNTPNVTASKQSDEMVKAKNAAGQTWRTKDKYWGGYESQERMNVVYDNVGHGNQYFDRIVNENLSKKNIKNRQVQEHLNIIAHEKAMRQLDSSFVSPFRNIEEQETLDASKDPLYKKVSKRLNKEIDYPDKPAKKGYPNEAPPEMVNGFHPDYGKSYKYDKLDPQSAEAMPVQGNPEIDANVQKALDKRAKNRKIKNLKIDAPTVENFSWKETLKEKKLEESKKGFKKFKQDLKEGMTTGSIMTLSTPPQGDGTVAIDSVDPLDNTSYAVVTDLFSVGDNLAANTGTTIRSSGSGSGTDGGFNVGGDYLAFQGLGTNDASNTRWAALSPMDSSAVDTITITAIVGNDTNGGEDPDAAGEGLVVMYKKPGMAQARFLNTDPQGVQRGTATSDIIIPLGSSSNSGLNSYSVEVPEYARAKDTQFVLIQPTNSGSEYDHYGITQIKVQRRAPVNVVVPLSDPAAISFINVGTTEGDPKKRKKKVQDQLDASDEYVTSQFGDDFPTGARLTSDDEIEASPIGNDEVKKSFADFQKGDEVVKTPEQIQAQNDEYFADLRNLLWSNEYDYADPQVLEITNKILETDPKNIDAYYYKSAYYDVGGDIEGARKVVDEMVKNNPDSPDGYSLRSFYKKEEGDLAGAIEDLEKTIELDPESEYIAYAEMELADLKYQEAEVEKDNAERDRMESEAGAIESKAHKDYWNNADLIEQDQEELAEYQYVSDDQLIRDLLGFDGFYGHPFRYAGRSDEVPNMIKAVRTYSSQLENTDKYKEYVDKYNDEYQEIIDAVGSWEGTETEWAKFYTDAYMRIVYPDSDSRTYNWIYKGALEDTRSSGGINAFGVPAGALGYHKLSKVDKMSTREVVYEFRRWLQVWWKMTRNDETLSPRLARARSADLKTLAPYLKALERKLPDVSNKKYKQGQGYMDYFLDPDTNEEPINTLYDQMKALYDEEDPEKEIKTDLKAQGYEKQYKDLMTAWDSADKFSKFITPLKNLSDALLGSKTAQNAKYENYKIAIAKSIMLNKPIRVNPDTIDPNLIKKLGDRITPNMILSYDEEKRFKEMQEKSAELVKAGKLDPSLLYDYDQPLATDGIPLIPIVSEPVPYADENIYEDEFGRVFTNDGSVDNTTMQPDRAYHSFASAYAAEVMRKNPIAGRGQAQYQIVVPPDGTEPYLLYKDHAYHNMKSTDEGEVPGFMNKGASGFVNWLGNTAHNRSDGDANTGGMAGYPPNIRGDVITEFRINVTDLPKEVQESVYRHPLVTDQPELVQLLRDKFYTDYTIKTFDFDEIDDPTGEKGKNVHGIYNNIILKQADKLKDFIVDNRVEVFLRGAGLIQGVLSGDTSKTNIGDLRTNSNLLQKYDDYIQQTIYSQDGKFGYVPGFTDADGKILDQRVDVTDSFTKNTQNELKQRLSDEKIQKNLKEYLRNVKNKPENIEMYKDLLQSQLNTAISRDNTSFVLGNSLGGGARVDVDEFLNGRLVIKKDFGFRHDEGISNVGFGYERQTFGKNWLKNAYGTIDDKLKDNGKFRLADQMAKLFDVSNDAWVHYTGKGSLAISTLASVGTMLAARQLLHPVQGPGQSFRDAMEKAPYMPYKVQFDFSDKMMNILNAGPEDDKPKDDSGLGSAGGYVGGDATAAATAAAEKDKDKNKNKNESTLYKKVIGKTLLKT